MYKAGRSTPQKYEKEYNEPRADRVAKIQAFSFFLNDRRDMTEDMSSNGSFSTFGVS